MAARASCTIVSGSRHDVPLTTLVAIAPGTFTGMNPFGTLIDRLASTWAGPRSHWLQGLCCAWYS